jgi:DNA-binding transcriptional LysR family regulator
MAKDLLAHAQALTNEFSSIQTKALLKLKVDQNIRISVLENFIQELQGYSPSVTLSLISPNSKQANNFDMYLTTKNNIEAMDWFIPLMNEQYCLLIPKVNHLAFKTDLSLFDLQDQPLITRIYCENKALFEKTCMDSGLVFNEVAEVETEEWAHALVRSGLGICFAPLPIGFMDSEFEIKKISELLPKAIPERVVGLCIKPGSQDKIKELLPYLLTEGALS